MPLRSRILSGNARLEDVAAGGPPVRELPHVETDPDAVRRIQKAMVALGFRSFFTSKTFSEGFDGEPDGRYGLETVNAVKAFQRLNFPNDPSRHDGRVGKITLPKMDEQLSEGPAPGPSRPPRVIPDDRQPFRVVPFTETSPFLISQQKDNRSKGDLSSTKAASISQLPQISQTRITAARLSRTSGLESDMLIELAAGGQLARDMGRTFINNSSVQVVPFADGSALSNAVRNSTPFPVAHNDVKNTITNHFRSTIAQRNEVDFHDLAAAKGVILPPVFGFSLSQDRPLKLAIGSFQGVDLFLLKFDASDKTRRWKGTLQYDFFDHFGADDSDTIPDTSGHGTAGQVALWVMQRERHDPNHFPLISKTTVVIDVEDAL